MESYWRSPADGSRYSSPWIGTCPFSRIWFQYSIAVIILRAKTNRLADLKPLAPRLLAAIESALPGVVEFIDAD
jgi:hypothetical protein